MTNQMSRYEPLDHRVPLLLTIHDLTFLHESPNEPRTVRTDRKLADLQRRIDRSIAITVDSEFVAADVRRELDVKDRPIHVIPLGLASAPPASASRPGFLADGRPFLLSIGTALAHKNFHSLFDLLEEFTDHRLVIAGHFATRYGEFLQGQVVQKRLQDRVLMPGEVSDPDRQWLYKRCEAFLFPSLSEGFGLPVLEAMACGVPVVISDRVNIWREIDSAGAGLVSPPDVDSVAAHILLLAGDPARAARMGSAGRRLAQARYDWAKVAVDLERVYSEHRRQ
jgi:glycosyltransferase involved in cell wall biosynthesis